MRKSQTHFEQISVEKVLDAIVKDAIVANFDVHSEVRQNELVTRRGQRSLLRCRICRKSVPVEIAKTDGEGQAVHEECYIIAMRPEPAGSRTRLAGF